VPAQGDVRVPTEDRIVRGVLVRREVRAVSTREKLWAVAAAVAFIVGGPVFVALFYAVVL
jgi:hypothetical protein